MSKFYKTGCNVLLIDSSAVIYKAIKTILAQKSSCFNVVSVATIEESTDLLREKKVDVVLVSLFSLDTGGLMSIMKLASSLPVIVLTSTEDEELSTLAIRNGAQDYILKKNITQPGLLSRTIRYAIERKKMQIELNNTKNKLEQANEEYSKDIKMAAELQKDLLPKGELKSKKISCDYIYHPCDDLGGDFLNYFDIDDDNVGFYILDVSGHGVAAALLSVQVGRVLNSKEGNLDLYNPSAVLEELNNIFQMDARFQKYFTIIYGVINQKGKMSFSSAGHPGPIYVTDSSAEQIKASGVPIGMFPSIEYDTISLSLKKGERILFFTDGLNEAENEKEEQFGMDGLIMALQFARNSSLKKSMQKILDEVKLWSDCDNAFEDDSTMLFIEFSEEQNANYCI